MARTEADELHDGLKASFAAFFDRIEDARLDERAGYRVVVCPRLPVPGLHGIWLDGPDEMADLDGLEAAVAEVERLGRACWVEVRPGRTREMEAAVRRLGFIEEGAIPGMVVRREELALVPGPALEFAQVRDAAGLAVAATVAAAGFEAPRDAISALFTPAVGTAPGVTVYVAYAQGAPVSTATAWLGDGGVGIYSVATPPEHRGRGYGRAITARAVQDGFDSGAEFAWLQSSALGESVYRSMGFRIVATYPLLGRPAAR